MLPSSTVENYLKAIVLAQHAGERVVSMGHIASSVGVTPGTATTMVKALAEAGLVEYEPYAGVRLTPAGEKLASLVLRRHRLVELFLVEVMQIPWDQVHDEAEQLEHVVSERLIERMDEMLGYPRVDPHGDPIPDAHGSIAHRNLHTLLECPLNAPLTITRVTDQDAAFLRFVEQNHLKPGESVEVESRDSAADSVRVRGASGQRVTIGARAASKLLVEVLPVLLWCLLAWTMPAEAQSAAGSAPRSGSDRPFEILDNSFLVEEAFNQEAGVVQSIFGVVRTRRGDWAATFTQEWPVPGQRHQLSYGLTVAHPNEPARFSDVAINYRLQVLAGEDGGLAFAPRASLLVHTEQRVGGDVGRLGMQFNLPFSRQVGDMFLHGNAGVTVYPRVGLGAPSMLPIVSEDHTLASPFVAGSAIWRIKPMLHLMFEGVGSFDEAVIAPDATGRDRSLVLAPGFRTGWNAGDTQIILGMAVPVTRDENHTSGGFILYGSYELPFWR